MRIGALSRRGAAVLGGLALLGLAGCDTSTLDRPDQPVVLTGAALPGLVGAVPGRIVAFAHSRPGGTPTWAQVPVQVDERKVVDFGRHPTSSTQVGTPGRVYGTTTDSGVTALQYTDTGTFVGADSDPAFDADDELVFMASDSGGVPRSDETTEPAGVVPGSGVRVQLTDPLGDNQFGWIHLFRSTGALAPGAGLDYVNYDFNLTSGPYMTTYKRAAGPNPETSVVTGADYEARLRDRWDDAYWTITAGDATGVDILDGYKSQFPGTCGRSNVTFQSGEGAFAANIDGPVRAIRSYVGANSGPYTQRTNFFYRDRQEIVTDLRVHAISGIQDYLDYSLAAEGMIYANSEHPDGAVIDGVDDPIGPELPSWELVVGDPGSVVVTTRLETTVVPPPGADIANQYYEDDLTPATPLPAKPNCWGDPHLLGASGSSVTYTIANTDPSLGAFKTLRTRRTIAYGAPQTTTADAERVAAHIDNPLEVAPSAYNP